MSNPFATGNPLFNGIALDIIPVVPDDANNNVGPGNVAIGLYVEGAGAVAFITADGHVRTVAVAAHSFLPVGTSRVLATGTTAGGVHALVV